MSDTQRVPEWYAARCGRVTASNISNVMMSKDRAGYRNYMAQLVCERLTGQPTETYTSPAMQHGIDTEAEARAAYSARVGQLVEEVGFIKHPKLEAGASPDGLVGTEGLVEIKCLQPAASLDIIESKKVPTEHRLQMMWQMAVTGRDWCDYVVYQPKLPDRLRLHIIRVHRDQSTILEITQAVTNFLSEVDRKVNHLKELSL